MVPAGVLPLAAVTFQVSPITALLGSWFAADLVPLYLKTALTLLITDALSPVTKLFTLLIELFTPLIAVTAFALVIYLVSVHAVTLL